MRFQNREIPHSILLSFLLCNVLLGSSLSSWFSDYPDYLSTGLKKTISEKGNQVILGSAAISVLIFHPYDRTVKDYSQEKGLLTEELSRFLDHYGGGAAYPLTLAGVGVTSYLQGDDLEEGLQKSKYVLTSVGMTALLTEIIKLGVGRRRPNGSDRKSFPSGHTSGSFVVASILEELYGRKIGVPAYIVAGLVGVQRIHDNKHWLTDVIAGAALGTIIGRGFGVIHRREDDDSSLSIIPARVGGDLYFQFIFPLN